MEVITVLSIILFGLAIYAINDKYKTTWAYKNKFIDTLKFTAEIPYNLDIVNLGSNQPKFAFDYTECNVSGMNWAVGPQSFDYDFRLLKQYHSYLREGAKVLIPICPFGFFLDKYSIDSEYHKYYVFFDSSLIHNYSKRTMALYVDYPVITAKKKLKSLVKDMKPDNRLDILSNTMNEDELKKDAHKWIDGWKQEFGVHDLDNTVLSKENINNIEKNITIIKEMIGFCIERSYRPVPLIIPVTEELGSLVPDSFVQEHILENIEKANYAGVPVLNYWKDSNFTSSDLYFNSFFFNKTGRRNFTAQVLKDI
jgi:hypothetical protein